MRRFVVIGQRALATPDFLLIDIPSTSGRLDVLLHCLRSALLVSHGVRRDTLVYLVLCGSPQPRVVRIDGSAARYLRPDERSLATLLRKLLAVPCTSAELTPVRAGVSMALGGLEVLDAELASTTCCVLDETGADLRAAELGPGELTFFVGDHLGWADETQTWLAARAAQRFSVGPVSLHSADAIAIVNNELDRRAL